MKEKVGSTKNLWQMFEDLPIVDRLDIIDAYYADYKARRHDHYYRVCQSGSRPEGDFIDPYDGRVRRMINFGSNDYLNLTHHPRVKRAAAAALEKYGVGAGGVPIAVGTLDIQQSLEQELAAFKGCEAAMVYTSGFGSNAGSILALLGPQDCAVCDWLIHASLVEGCRGTHLKRFYHNDMSHLESVLQNVRDAYRTKLVIVDGVYSMDGDIALLDEIVVLAHRYGALVLVDEAHATGVIGPDGRGTPAHFDLEGQVDIVAGTLSKAVGVVGGFIAGSRKMIQYLRFFSKSHLYSTAMTPPATAAIRESLRVIAEESEIRVKLWENIDYFRENLLDLGFDLNHTQTAIFPIMIGNDNKVNEICRSLHEADVLANPVCYPVVSASQGRIRFSLTAGHTRAHLDRTLNLLHDLGKAHQVI